MPAPVRYGVSGLLLLCIFLAGQNIAGKGTGEEGVPRSLWSFSIVVLAVAACFFLRPERLIGASAPDFDWNSFWGGSLAVAAGLFQVAASVLDRRDEAFNGPRWLLAVCGLVFVAGGIAALRSGTGVAVGDGDLATVFMLLIMLSGFGALSTWVAFGPGKREFEGGISVPFFAISYGSDELSGRIAFGIAAVIIDALAISAWGAVLVGLFKWVKIRVGKGGP